MAPGLQAVLPVIRISGGVEPHLPPAGFSAPPGTLNLCWPEGFSCPRCSVAKFLQNPSLGAFLGATDDRSLVEASLYAREAVIYPT